MRILHLIVAGAAFCLALSGCSSEDSTVTHQSNVSSDTPGQRLNVNLIPSVPDIVAMVPQELAKEGVLRVGITATSPPAEFFLSDGTTPWGYNVEIAQALARVMGIETVEFVDISDYNLTSEIGFRIDLGMSSIRVTPEMMQRANLVTYLEGRSSFIIIASNPSNFDPDSPCGTTVGVLKDSPQAEQLLALSTRCVAENKQNIDIQQFSEDAGLALSVLGGGYDAVLASTSSVNHAVAGSNDTLAQIGEPSDPVYEAVAVSRDDPQLTVAVQAAMQKLMDEGYLSAILANYSTADSALSLSRINPRS